VPYAILNVTDFVLESPIIDLLAANVKKTLSYNMHCAHLISQRSFKDSVCSNPSFPWACSALIGQIMSQSVVIGLSAFSACQKLNNYYHCWRPGQGRWVFFAGRQWRP